MLTFNGKQVEIKDFEAFYEVQKQIANDILSLYRDPKADEKTADDWIRKKTAANAQVKALKQFLDRDLKGEK